MRLECLVSPKARTVKLNVFSCPDGYVVSPACMLASEEARRRHGPITGFAGTLKSGNLPIELRSSIERALEGESFAYVDKHQATLLEGLTEPSGEL